MILTPQRIVNALRIIKEICQDADNDCDICPLGRADGSCMVSHDIPDSWKISDLPELWRALK